jgi:hypothetical protein
MLFQASANFVLAYFLNRLAEDPEVTAWVGNTSLTFPPRSIRHCDNDMASGCDYFFGSAIGVVDSEMKKAW